ncbi:HupE/UreJ family protein [Allorhizobium sp. BGMRC 0089]|uniref:HupE/UreJ family protein n=1 Tax=Allorhizobium sonneratiae TaxID=2934936 RepID=UPI0020343B93|nr:HupE/UreJ family protein [Allorhizobium sonneratiae]MCM2291173.1 HupE/UreJ family protein [Allorhizobium sonneratiae]
MFKRLFLTTAAFALAAAPAFAHLNPADHGSVLAGLTHPLTGPDHIMAMVAVGLWASQQGGKALYAVPCAFVLTMAIGFLMALAGIPLPFVEPAILASVMGLGLLVATAIRLPAAGAAAVVALFALFHGYAHGTELHGATALEFGLGFVVATAFLHAVGLGLGVGLNRFGPKVTRLLGVATALGGAALMLG